MNILANLTASPPLSPQPPLTLEEARIKVLDAFFELEIAVGRWARLLSHRDANAPFGNRMQAVANDPKLAEKTTGGQVKYLRDLPNKVADIVRIRNAVAHSRTSVGTYQGKRVIFFETASTIFAGEGAVIPLSIEAIAKSADDARRIAGELNNFIRQNQIKAERDATCPIVPSA